MQSKIKRLKINIETVAQKVFLLPWLNSCKKKMQQVFPQIRIIKNYQL